MELRSDLSNDIVAIETGDEGIRCMIRSRGLRGLWLAILLLMFTGFLSYGFAADTLTRMKERRLRDGDVFNLVLSSFPFVATAIVLIHIVRRRAMPRGIEISNGVVKLFTPDLTTGLHTFDLTNLKGAVLTSTADNRVNLNIERRSGGLIPVLLGYRARDVGTCVDVINQLITEDRQYGFDIIPIAKLAESTAPSENKNL